MTRWCLSKVEEWVLSMSFAIEGCHWAGYGSSCSRPIDTTEDTCEGGMYRTYVWVLDMYRVLVS